MRFEAGAYWKILTVVTATAGTLFLCELSLRAAGFEFHLHPAVEFGWPDPATLDERYEDDPDLFWVPRNYAEALVGARMSRPAVVFMGDSVTEFGTYPQATLRRLGEQHPELKHGISVGVGGWSSEQGLAQLQRDVLPLRPIVITIYYGWNDHWVALGPPDPVLRGVTSFADGLRLGQLVKKARMALLTDPERPNRVSRDRYRRNLETMARLGEEAGAEVVLITAPSNHEPGREPEYLGRRHLRDLDDLVPLHQSYVQATREAARATAATLCDVAARFDADPQGAREYFGPDGIHLSEDGDEQLAELLADCISDAVSG